MKVQTHQQVLLQDETLQFEINHALQGAFLNAVDRVESAIRNNEPDILHIARNVFEGYCNIQNLMRLFAVRGKNVYPLDGWLDEKWYALTFDDLRSHLSPESRAKITIAWRYN